MSLSKKMISKKNNYIKLNENDLSQLHNDLLPLLIEVDRICRKHDIKYFLSDGTLLGAVRHKGFIPWDDDIDIQMLRADYERFWEICKSELNHKLFFIQNQEIDKNYNWVYGKLRLKNTRYVRAGQEHLKQDTGIFIDIFPIDKISDNVFLQSITKSICKCCRKILWSSVGSKTEEKLFVRIGFRILKIIPRDLVILIFKKVSTLYKNVNTNFLTSNNLEYRNDKKYVFKKEWYENTVDLEFEGHMFLAPIGYENILRLTYGNYMEFPPKSERHGRCYASYIKFSNGKELMIK